MAIEGQDSNLGQQMDKIAYGLAGAIVLAVAFFVLFAGRDANTALSDAKKSKTAAELREKEDVNVGDVPDLIGTISAQWRVPDMAEYTTWSTERMQGLMQFVAEQEGIRIDHPKPKMVRVTYLRHDKTYQVYVRVEGSLGDLENSEYTSIKLYKKADGDDTFLPVKDFDSDKNIDGSDVRYVDHKVEPGKKYAYQLRTKIQKSEDADENSFLPEDNVDAASGEAMMPHAIPFDYHIRVQFAKGFDPSKSGDAAKAFFFGDITVASKDPGAEPEMVHKASDGKIYEGYTFGPEVSLRGGKKGPAFVVLGIENNRVEIRDQRNRSRTVFTQKSETKELILPLDAELSAGSSEEVIEEEVIEEESTEEELVEEEVSEDSNVEEGTEDATEEEEDTSEEESAEEEEGASEEEAPKKKKKRDGFR